MTSSFVCATLNLGRKKSTGTEPWPTYISSTRWIAIQEGVTNQQRTLNSTAQRVIPLIQRRIHWILTLCRYSMGSNFYLTQDTNCKGLIEDRLKYVRKKFSQVQDTFLSHLKPQSDIRGLFKKFWYERLSIHKYNVCSTGFVHKYSSFYHTFTCEISKESSKYQ